MYTPRAFALDDLPEIQQLIQHTHLSLTQISLECGFCDQAHFCHMFTRSEGVNPMTWRNHHLRHKLQVIAA